MDRGENPILVLFPLCIHLESLNVAFKGHDLIVFPSLKKLGCQDKWQNFFTYLTCTFGNHLLYFFVGLLSALFKRMKKEMEGRHACM